MKRWVLVTLEGAVVLAAIGAVSWSFHRHNEANALSVAQGLVALLVIAVLVPALILVMRYHFHHPERSRNKKTDSNRAVKSRHNLPP